MLPGVYCLESDFVMDGGTSLSGPGVLIYLKHGQMHITGGVGGFFFSERAIGWAGGPGYGMTDSAEAIWAGGGFIALWTTLITFGLSLILWRDFDPTTAQFQFVEQEFSR